MIGIQNIEKARLPANIKARFRRALITNSENAEEIINKAILDYIEKSEEEAAAKRLHEIADMIQKSSGT